MRPPVNTTQDRLVVTAELSEPLLFYYFNKYKSNIDRAAQRVETTRIGGGEMYNSQKVKPVDQYWVGYSYGFLNYNKINSLHSTLFFQKLNNKIGIFYFIQLSNSNK